MRTKTNTRNGLPLQRARVGQVGVKEHEMCGRRRKISKLRHIGEGIRIYELQGNKSKKEMSGEEDQV